MADAQTLGLTLKLPTNYNGHVMSNKTGLTISRQRAGRCDRDRRGTLLRNIIYGSRG